MSGILPQMLLYGDRVAEWSNWAGNQRATGIEVVAPRDLAGVVEAVRQAAERGRGVRPIGSGHSFAAIGVPRDVQLDLRHLSGVVRADAETGLVTVRGGTRLSVLNRALAALGLAMTNLGDIEEQTIAGAIATGTHGTGARFGGLATQVRGLELVTADGSVLTCSPTEHPEVFDVARLGLGAFGVVTAVTLQTEPAYAVTARERGGRLADAMAAFDEDAEHTDHVEFYWFPHTDRVLTKHNTRHPPADLPACLDPLPRLRAWWDDDLLTNTLLGAMTAAGRRVPALVRPFARIAGHALGPREYTDLSYKVFTSPRRVRFEEMEYAVPRAVGMDVLREVVAAVERSDWRIAVPVEVRVAAADDVPLSTAYERDTVYLAVHTPPGAPDRDAYFDTVERIATAAGGRPHWGKLHGLDAAALRERYPRFDEAVALRERLDPDGVLGNAYLDRVLGSST